MPLHLIRHTPPLIRPDLTPLAGVFLLLSFFVVLIYYPAEPMSGLVALHETPLTDRQVCFNVPNHTRITAYLTADSRTSFTVSDAELQIVVLKQVSRTSGQQALTETQLLTCLTTAQLLSPAMTGLPAYPYLIIDANTSSAIVMQLLHSLQRHQFNRFNLITHYHA